MLSYLLASASNLNFSSLEKATIKAMGGVKLIEKSSEEFAGFGRNFGQTNQSERNVLRGNNDDILRRALNFEVVGRKGRGRPKVT